MDLMESPFAFILAGMIILGVLWFGGVFEKECFVQIQVGQGETRCFE